MSNAYVEIKEQIPSHVTLIAVSKTYSTDRITEVYSLGQRDFGENKVQELLEKSTQLPNDIRWHLIGHLQTNKVKQVLPFVHLIHAVDSEKLVDKIQQESEKIGVKTAILLQVKIASEDTKYGLSKQECLKILNQYAANNYPNISIKGLMGMASFTDDRTLIASEFEILQSLYDAVKEEHSFDTLSMGMSDDFPIAIAHGSTMVRIGSKIFGSRNY